MKKGRTILYIAVTAFMLMLAIGIILLAVNASGKSKEKRQARDDIKAETDVTIVQAGQGELYMSIEIPKGWEYECSEEKDYEISFWPQGRAEGKIKLRASKEMFGVCGTELVEKKSVIGKYQVNQGYYGGKTIWNYTSFPDYSNYTILNEGAETWWHEYEEELVKILETIVLRRPVGDLNMSTEEAITDFGLQLFKQSLAPEGNSVISPISVLYALAMVANGAEGETLAQMEDVFGLSVEELNQFMGAYMNSLPEGEDYKLNIANGIWFEENADFTVKEDFLKTNEDIYKAKIEEAKLHRATVDKINEWVSEKTKGRIKNLLGDLPEEAVMCLVNALSFDAKWDTIYDEHQVREEKFITEDGAFQDAQFMFSKENKYIETEQATGFMKYYEDAKYAFVALLPKESISVEMYLESLNGEALHQMIENAISWEVKTSIPKFTATQSVGMMKVLEKMGMEKAFNGEQAEFGGIGTMSDGYNLSIGQIAHKAFISVHEKGTEAGAATAITVNGASAPQYEPKEVYLDRPFVYLIVDCESNLPIFMGTVMEVNGR